MQPLFDEPFLRAQSRHTLNAIIYRLYRLTPEEVATVEAG